MSAVGEELLTGSSTSVASNGGRGEFSSGEAGPRSWILALWYRQCE